MAVFSSTCGEPKVLGSPELLSLQLLQSFSRKGISPSTILPLCRAQGWPLGWKMWSSN